MAFLSIGRIGRTSKSEVRRPAHGHHSRWNDEHWRDYILFYECFHGDTGVGIGASHQTGWTGAIAFLMQGFTAVEAEEVLDKGMGAVKAAHEGTPWPANKK